ncbi:endopeptidase La [bacterium]|nr:endopeptidase La [bacterium]MBU1753419.1 endopeptidase La [bacterium]
MTTTNIVPNVPLLPLRDMVIFPQMIVPLFVGRKRSIQALELAMLDNRMIFLCAQKKSTASEPKKEDIYTIGTCAEILQLLKLPDGTLKILVEGLARGKITKYIDKESYYCVDVEPIVEKNFPTPEIEAVNRAVLNRFQEYVRLSDSFPPEMIGIAESTEDPGRLADTIASHISLKTNSKQELLETINVANRLEKLSVLLNAELEILQIEKKLHVRIRKQVEKHQKQYYLNEKLRAIKKELGKDDEGGEEIIELKKQIKDIDLPPEALQRANKEIKRLQGMPSMMPETAVIKNHLDWLIHVPWSKATKDNLGLKRASRILEENHYGLKKVKERIIECLAVRKLNPELKGSILCFVGPPGTGKTSVAKSIAAAMDRRFVRLSLGGVRDEAEIRGHRMTYVAAMPGRIIQSIRKAESKNPVFLLDEIDKMSMDFRGDPSAALLEVLDPEQNTAFSDHYLEVAFDLSAVMFITTANTLHNIPHALRDRMEMIEFPGYTEEEKLHIAKTFLITKKVKEHGLTEEHLEFSDESLLYLIRGYTREPGVRNLEREIARVCRKIARKVVESKKEKKKVEVTIESLHNYLGSPKFKHRDVEKNLTIGIATGLAWTENGGEVLTTEVVTMPGKGELLLTGTLGEVMKESGKAALSYIRSRAVELSIDPEFYKKMDIHVHVPEGAIPKDGPSAGITMAISMISALTNTPVNPDIAMTGEITLRGRVLPVGGIKEKILAAHRSGIKTVLLPQENENDLDDIPKDVKKSMGFKLVGSMDEVIRLALNGRC